MEDTDSTKGRIPKQGLTSNVRRKAQLSTTIPQPNLVPLHL